MNSGDKVLRVDEARMKFQVAYAFWQQLCGLTSDTGLLDEARDLAQRDMSLALAEWTTARKALEDDDG